MGDFLRCFLGPSGGLHGPLYNEQVKGTSDQGYSDTKRQALRPGMRLRGARFDPWHLLAPEAQPAMALKREKKRKKGANLVVP